MSSEQPVAAPAAPTAQAEREFPILMTPGERHQYPTCPRSVPWSMVAPHDAQAQKNHGGQTLARLAERGGLSPVELLAVLADRDFPWREIARDRAAVQLNAVAEITRRSAAWRNARAARPAVSLLPALTWRCTLCETLNVLEGGTAAPGPVPVECRFCHTAHAGELQSGGGG